MCFLDMSTFGKSKLISKLIESYSDDINVLFETVLTCIINVGLLEKWKYHSIYQKYILFNSELINKIIIKLLI